MSEFKQYRRNSISRTNLKTMIEDSIVIVLDNGNYKTSFAEKTPFKAKVFDKTENEIWVKSLKTGKEYELYPTQILECFDIETIKNLLDMSKYGL